jgi:hypothetical protein
MVCTRRGLIGADARPNWKEQPTRPSLTGIQWDTNKVNKMGFPVLVIA